MINTIVFDFGGVLVDWNPRHFYKEIFKDNNEMEWFLSHICNEEWNLEQDRGRSFAEGVALLQKSFPEHSENIALFYTHWEKMLKGELSETVDILEHLKKDYKIYGLTNWSAETFPVALNRFDFFQFFDGIVVSGNEKMIKPDKRFFQLLLDRYNLKSENCVFIDDNKGNVDTACELGFHAIHYRNTDQLKSALIALEVWKA